MKFRVRARRELCVSGVVTALIFGLGSPTLWAADFPAYQAHLDGIRKDPTLLRLYAFDEKSGDTLHNLAGKDSSGDISIAANPAYIESHSYRQPQDFATWTTGRWPGKGALAFGAAPKSASKSHFYSAPDNHFTVVTWVRTYRDPGDKAAAELCYVDDTITSGWKISTGPGYTAFQLGRPPGKDPGQGGVSVFGPALTGHIWHQVAAVLDGSVIRLYVDGKLAKEREFDGIYNQPKVADRAAKAPELDTTGLSLGNRTVVPADAVTGSPKPLFDMDEFALFGRVLTADEIADDFAAGSPGESAADQVAAHKAALARRRALAKIALSIPTDTFGYFPVGRSFNATISVPADAGVPEAARSRVVLTDFGGGVLNQAEKPLTAGTPVTVPVNLPRCGLYNLDLSVLDAQGTALCSRRYSLGAVAALQQGALGTVASPLAGHDIIQTHPADGVLGARIDRMIAPFLRIMPDGTYDWSIPDACVDEARKSNLDVLYTIYPPFNMPHNSPQELAKDPERWSSWVKDLVTHFKDKVHIWEIWNEPNAVPGFSPTDYLTLLKSGYQAIKAVDPTATVVGGCGVYTIAQWTEAVLQAGGGEYMDVLSVHNYVGTSPITYRNRFGKVRQVQALVKRYVNHPLPVWNSEGGIHQPARIDGKVVTDAQLLKLYGTRANSNDGWANANVDAIMMTTEHRSACWNVQSILLDLADGDAKYFTLMGAGTFYPFKSGSQGLPTEKGVSYAALSFVLAGSKSIGFIPLSHSKAAAIAVEGANGKRTAVLFSDVPLEFTFDASDGQKFSGMDFLGNPLQWTAGDGGLTIRTADEPVYLVDIPAGFAERRLLSYSDFPKVIQPGQSVDGVLNIANPGKKPISGTLSAGSIAGQVTVAPNVTVPPGTGAKVPFRFTADGTSRGARTISFALKSSGKVISQLEIPFTAAGPAKTVPQFGEALKLDGKPEVWAALAPETADSADKAVIGKPDVGFANKNTWQGAEDCSFKLKTAWRAGDGLYLQIEVADDAFFPTPAGNSQPWLWDGVELFVDTRQGENRTAAISPGAQQIMVIPVKSATAAPCVAMNLAGASATVNAQFVGRTTDHGYVLEGKLTPKDGTEFKPGIRLGLDVAVDDNDDGSKRKVQLALHGSASNSVDASKWGEYELGGATR